jgi:hypothetical protein
MLLSDRAIPLQAARNVAGIRKILEDLLTRRDAATASNNGSNGAGLADVTILNNLVRHLQQHGEAGPLQGMSLSMACCGAIAFVWAVVFVLAKRN